MTSLDHFSICSQCIRFLTANPKPQIQLSDLAKQYALSETQLQKIFKQYVGVSPKQFQQSVLVNQSQSTLKGHSLLHTSLQFDLSSPARLHDAYVQITAMSPGEFKSLGETLTLSYCQEDSLFGKMLAITTDRGLFYLGFHDNPLSAIEQITSPYPKAQLVQLDAGSILGYDPVTERKPIDVHIAATNFQVHVWQALLSIPAGKLISYKGLADTIGKPTASRAVGQAVGKNPIAALIPCHRVIQQSGALSGYRWGTNTKQGLLAWEFTKEPI